MNNTTLISELYFKNVSKVVTYHKVVEYQAVIPLLYVNYSFIHKKKKIVLKLDVKSLIDRNKLYSSLQQSTFIVLYLSMIFSLHTSSSTILDKLSIPFVYK